MSQFFATPENLQANFDLPARVDQVVEYGAGHINDTFVVRCGAAQFLLQRLNGTVFPDVQAVMANVERVTRHLATAHAQSETVLPGWQTLTLIRTVAGGTYCLDELGHAWRMFDFVRESQTIETAGTANQLYQAALAFGHFQYCLRSLPGPPLTETIARFHDTAWRFEKLQQSIDANRCDRVRHCAEEIRGAFELFGWANVLSKAQAQGDLRECVVHNDTKLNNVLFDGQKKRAICVVDLDTVMPGLAPHDFGDLVRSALPRTSESAQGEMVLDGDLFRALASGFVTGSKGLPDAELPYLASGAVIMALEVGVRFLTDYLDGDLYFKTRYDNHNLVRAGGQLRLAAALAEREQAFTEMLRDI